VILFHVCKQSQVLLEDEFLEGWVLVEVLVRLLKLLLDGVGVVLDQAQVDEVILLDEEGHSVDDLLLQREGIPLVQLVDEVDESVLELFIFRDQVISLRVQFTCSPD